MLNFSLLDYRGQALRAAPGRRAGSSCCSSPAPTARSRGRTRRSSRRSATSSGPRASPSGWSTRCRRTTRTTGELDAMFALGRDRAAGPDGRPLRRAGDAGAGVRRRSSATARRCGRRRGTTSGAARRCRRCCATRTSSSPATSASSGTCDTIVIDTEKMAVVYRGAVDDQFAEGAKRPRATAHYLRDALAEFLAGRPVTTPQTTAARLRRHVRDRAGRRADLVREAGRAAAPARAASAATARGNIGPFAMSATRRSRGGRR